MSKLESLIRNSLFDVNFEIDWKKRRLLHIACAYQNEKAVKILLSSPRTRVFSFTEDVKLGQYLANFQVSYIVRGHQNAISLFAMMTLMNSDLLQVDNSKEDKNSRFVTRFFSISRDFPIEMKMMLCFRIYSSANEIINQKDFEIEKERIKGILFKKNC